MKSSRWWVNFLRCQRLLEKISPALQAIDWGVNLRPSLRTVPTNSKVFLRGFMNMWEKQISTSVIKSKKKIGGHHAFYEDN